MLRPREEGIPLAYLEPLQRFCREFFYGTSERGLRGRYVTLIFDSLVIVYFVITTFIPLNATIKVTDIVIGTVLLIELAGRVLADYDRMRFLSKPLALLDLAIIVSLFVPATLGNFAFLRVIRALRVLRSYVMTQELRSLSRFFARNEEVIFSAINLLVFIFVVTAVVFVAQHETNPEINNYIDALYFTITTLTTTGFGDVILVGSAGRLLAVVVMIVGVALFVRLVQTIFRPTKVRYECPRCGLTRHDLDAVHCKHCGEELHIRTEGL
jgi:voltage-gated potassium channel